MATPTTLFQVAFSPPGQSCETITVVIGVMPLMTPTIELATVCSAKGNSRERNGVVEDAEDQELPVEVGIGRQFLAGGEKHQPADRGAPMVTRPAETQSGLISRISTALNRNEQPQTAPSRIMSSQYCSFIGAAPSDFDLEAEFDIDGGFAA